MKLVKYLANLGYGTRREVARMFVMGRVTRTDGSDLAQTDDIAYDDVLVDGMPLDPPPGAVIMLHKPIGYVTSTTDTNPVVYDLLPHRFRLRSPIMAPVGRLDLDTSGLLLLTDDGQLNHRITSPRTHLPKTYVATVADAVSAASLGALSDGSLILKGDDSPIAPAVVEAMEEHRVRVTITEGRYHQVRRMFAAVGNHVTALHRESVGPLQLDGLGEGEWRVLRAEEMAALTDVLKKPRP